jgi:molybdopterin converting factor small subunit
VSAPGSVTIRLPRVLAQVTGGERKSEVRARTLGEALSGLIEQQPVLGYHLFDEAGRMRRHIMCFCNDEYRRGRDGLEVPVRTGDTITILNSVSGSLGRRALP